MKIETNGTKLAVTAPYHPDFPTRAKKIGGRWDAGSKTWTFDARDEARVRKLCVDVYGTDGSPLAPEDLLTVRAPASVCERRHSTFGGSRPTSFWLASREVAHARGRDSGATLGDGVVVLKGGFSSGGSVKNPSCTYRDGTVFELRDVPRAAAAKVHEEYHGVALLDASGNVVAEASSEEQATPEPTEAERVELEIAAAEGRLLGLRFRAAELKAA